MLILIIISLASSISPNIGWGGTISLNSNANSVCAIGTQRQTLQNRCLITCPSSGTSLVQVIIVTSTKNTTELYTCVTKPAVTSIDQTIIYSSTPYNLSITGTNFYPFFNTKMYCALNSTIFSASFVNSTRINCTYTSIKASNYSLSLLPNGVDSVGSISLRVQNSYKIQKMSTNGNYIGSTVIILGKNLDVNLFCNFSQSASVRVTLISSSNVTCVPTAGIPGNFSVQLQNSAGMPVSSLNYFTFLSKFTLRSAGPVPITEGTSTVDYSGTILGTIYCVINGKFYLSEYNNTSINCLLNGLSQGDYTITIRDSFQQVSVNSINIFIRENQFEATFIDGSDVTVIINTQLSLFNVYCRWGTNDIMKMLNMGTYYLCPTSTVKDRGEWCLELSNDGVSFTDTCKFTHNVTRLSNFVMVDPEQVVLGGEKVKIYYNKLYEGYYQCEIEGYMIDAVTNTTIENNNSLTSSNSDTELDLPYLQCTLPSLTSPGTYKLNIYEDDTWLRTFSITYVNYLSISSTFPKFITSETTSIQLYGSNFYSSIPCYISKISAACSFISTSSLSCTFDSETSSISIYCLNINNEPSPSFKVSLRPIPKITELLPNNLYEGIYNLIYILGSDFTEDSYLKLYCNDSVFKTTFINNETLSATIFLDFCDQENVTLAVSPNDLDYSMNSTLEIFKVPCVTQLSFYSSPYFGGDVLKFFGNGFVGNLFCDFGGDAVEAQVTSYDEGNCTVPYHDMGTVNFTVFLNGLDFRCGMIEYTFDDLIEFLIQPDSGPMGGGTVVKVIGFFSELLSPVYCVFGDSQVEASFNSDLICITPGGIGQVIVYIYSGTKLYSSYKHVYFNYLSYPEISSLSIVTGPSKGNSTVIMTGTGFDYNYNWECFFGTAFTPSVFLSTSSVLCYSPAQPPGEVKVGISNNWKDASNMLDFQYLTDISVLALSPNIGPSTGLTQVTLSGKGLSKAVYCKIGSQIFLGTTSNSIIKCTTQAYYYGSTPIEISNNRIDFTRSKIPFEYVQDFQVTNIWPILVPNNGTTVLITARNTPSNLKCRIGSTETAVIYNNNNFLCKIPASSSVTIELTVNSQNYWTFAETTTLRVYTNPVFTSISQGFVNRGSYVKLQASNLIVNNFLSVKFSSYSYFRVISSSSLVFKVPFIVSGNYSLQVGNNDQDFIHMQTLMVSDQMQVITAVPNLATIRGGTVFTIRVENAVNSSFLTCQFLRFYEKNLNYTASFTVSATFINSTHINCTSPTFSFPGEAFIRVSNDNQFFSVSSFKILLIDTCKDRVICNQNTISACLPGAYCLADYWYDTLNCPNGTYQNNTLQTGCIRCPRGQICTSPTIPSLCPFNYTCSVAGLMYPDYLCPSGYYCPVNTSRADKICNKGEYCRGTNSSCTDGFICKRGASEYYGEAACPEGFFCIGYKLYVCPTRHYCPGTGNSQPVPCPAGTYNSLLGQSECKSCPIGFVCPHPQLLRPIICPKGYICNIEGLSFPIKLCTPGYFCPEGVYTEYLETPCFGITEENSFDSSFCAYDTMVYSGDEINFSANISQFNFTSQNLCCWNSSKTAEFISSISPLLEFQELASYFFNKGYVGLHLYTANKDYTQEINSQVKNSSVTRKLVDTNDILTTLQNKETLSFYVFQLLNLNKPSICKAGVFCLEGVTIDAVIENVVRSAKTCNPGTYCESGSSTPAGQLCPSGYHCPSGSSAPIENSPGTSTGFSGNVFEGSCAPNFYTNQNSSTFCYNCPDGYECKVPGTIWPSICMEGYYRNYMESSICSECPLSSFSFDFGIISERECQPCNSGRMCLLAGTSNISLSSPCTQGELCEEASDISLHEKCPAGFLCAAGTTPETKYNIPCITGFYCPAGMKFLNKYLYPCPEFAYCPPATYDYSIFYADPETAQATSREFPPTKCPKGTGKVNEGSRNSLIMCQMFEEYITDNPIFEINPIVESISTNFTLYYDNVTDEHIFHLNSRQVALITFDLLHVNNASLLYGIDWALSFTIFDSILNGSIISPVPMPQSFLRSSVDKTNVLEFTILAWTALDFKVSILIYNGLFHSYSNLFVNTTSVEVFTANRGIYGSTDTYLIMIDNTVALPFNNPNPDVALSFYLLTFAPSPERANLERVEKVNDENWFQPNTKFWGDNSAFFLPYFPYFSNCKGYGQYIPVWVPLELSPECVLIPPAQTKPIIPFYFGSKPVADSCLNVVIECVYDELIGDAQGLPRWFELPAGTPMFYITQTVVIDDDFLNQATSVPLISGLTVNESPSGSLPNLIEIQILYQQFDVNTKRIILLLITFLNFTSLSANQQLGIDQVPYNLSLVYRAMDQKELLINFVFDYIFYFTLFVLVGIITIIFTLMFWIYHKIFCDVEPRPKFQFINYFILKLRPPFEGFMLGFIPVFATFCINSYLMVGYLLGDFFPVAGKVPLVNNGIFDSMMPTYKDFTTNDPSNVQRARLGTSLIAMGAYIMWEGAKMFILDDPEEPSQEPSGNFWSYIKWKRMNLIFVSIISIAGLQGLVQLTYSAVFGLYSYVFIVVLFVVGTILGYYLTAMLTDELLAEPINQAVGIVTGIATFGASDFVNFLTGYFVGLMNLFVMRLYLDFINDWFTGILEAFFDRLGALQYELTDIQSYVGIWSRLKNLGSMAPLEGDEEFFEPEEIEVLENYDSDEDEIIEENSYYTYDDVQPSPVVPEPEGQPLDEQEFESLLGHIIGYSGDLLGYFYNPMFTIMCWNYYDYIPFFSAYGIAKGDVWLYVLFGTVMIPFQLATDIILHNANELYNGWAVHDFLDFMREKYANRKQRWIGSDPQNEEIIDDPIRNVYRVCMTPHFFFMSTVFDSGFCYASIGFVTILNNPGYNAFDDRATIPIILFSLVLCWAIKQATIIIGNILGIWVVKNVENAEDQQIEIIEEFVKEQEPDAVQLFNEIYVRKENVRIVPDIKNWNEVELVKASDENLKRDLDSEILRDEKTREKFLEVNQEWLQKNLNLIFADENFDENRGAFLTKLSKMYGFLEQPTENRKFPELELTEIKIENPSIIAIGKYWLARAQRNRKLMLQMSCLLEEKIQESCIYCEGLYMLQCELLENVEELFGWFKEHLKFDERNRLFEWRAEDWIEFVRKSGHFRTVCLECFERCEEFYRYSAATNERSVIKKRANEGMKVKESVRNLALKWVSLARNRLG